MDPATGARLKFYFEPGPLWGRPQKPADLSREDVSATFPDRRRTGSPASGWKTSTPASVKRFQLSKETGRRQGAAIRPGVRP